MYGETGIIRFFDKEAVKVEKLSPKLKKQIKATQKRQLTKEAVKVEKLPLNLKKQTKVTQKRQFTKEVSSNYLGALVLFSLLGLSLYLNLKGEG